MENRKIKCFWCEGKGYVIFDEDWRDIRSKGYNRFKLQTCWSCNKSLADKLWKIERLKKQ